MSREYSENVLVQNSAGNLLQNVLGWEVVLAYNSEKLGPDGTLGRTGYGEVLLTRYFRQALLRLNPWLTPNQLDEVQKKFTAHVSTVVSVSKGSSFTSSPSIGTGKLNTIFFIQLPSFLFSGNISIRSIKAFINSFCSASVAEW